MSLNFSPIREGGKGNGRREKNLKRDEAIDGRLLPER